MKLLDVRTITLEFADLATRRPIARPAGVLPRAPGAHQSDILAYIARKIGVLKPGERLESEMPLIFGLGFAWEEYIFSFYPHLDWQPGEMTVDGISVNCDGITAADPTYGCDVMEEAKFTFKAEMSGEDFISPKNFMWLHQGRSYCHLYGPRVERWHVCHVRGDYKVFGPVYRQYVVEFTDKECEQTWAMLRTNLDAAMAGKRADDLAAVIEKATARKAALLRA